MNSYFGALSKKPLLLALISLVLISCGGGGGGGGSTPPLVVATTDLRITEVAAKARSDGAEGGWLEVHNPTAAAINLADYSLSSTAYTTATFSMTTATFALPAMNLPAGGFVVLASKALYFLPDGTALKYIGTPGLYPSWTDSGYLQIKRIADSKVADFVRFGSSTALPSTATEWTGTAAASLPNSTATQAYGKSMVRLASGSYADTNSAADWVLVNFSTPGGRNDIAPGVVDSDADGVPDSAKLLGGTYAGLDLYAMGARPGMRDIFLEIQVMDQSPTATVPDLGMIPRQEALQKVVDAFALKNIRLHIDAGPRFSATFSPANFNLGGGNAAGTIAFSPCTDMPIVSTDVVRPGCSNFFQHKNSNFDVRRRVMFSYNLFANSQLPTGLSGSSGYAEIRGNDSMITMGGGWGFTTAATASFSAAQNTARYINMQGSTLMHEFGHNLGLRHGGFENLPNYKPNYVSVMNYMYQLVGIPGVTNDSTVGDRYQYYVDGLNPATSAARNSCLMSNTRCGNAFIMDYSNGTSPDLDENALVGSNLIGRGTPTFGSFVNWSGTATSTTTAYAFNVNRDFVGTTPLLQILKDYNDWANIRLPFVRSLSGFYSGASPEGRAQRPDDNAIARRDPMNDAAEKEFVREDPPSPQMLRELRDEGLVGFRIRP